jgi:hypothetical protein
MFRKNVRLCAARNGRCYKKKSDDPLDRVRAGSLTSRNARAATTCDPLKMVKSKYLRDEQKPFHRYQPWA